MGLLGGILAAPHLAAMPLHDVARAGTGTGQRLAQPGAEGLGVGSTTCPAGGEQGVAAGAARRAAQRQGDPVEACFFVQAGDQVHRAACQVVAVDLHPQFLGHRLDRHGHRSAALDLTGQYGEQVAAVHVQPRPLGSGVLGGLHRPLLERLSHPLGLIPDDLDELPALPGLHVGIVDDGLDGRPDAAQGRAGALGQPPQQSGVPAGGTQSCSLVVQHHHEAGDPCIRSAVRTADGASYWGNVHLKELLAAQRGGDVRRRAGVADAVQRVGDQTWLDDSGQRPAQPQRGIVAEQRARRGVEEQDPAFRVADQHRHGQLGHQRGQQVALLLETGLRGIDLPGHLSLGDTQPFGQPVHRLGQVCELGRAEGIEPVRRVGPEHEARVGGEPARGHGVRRKQSRQQHGQTGEHQRHAQSHRDGLVPDSRAEGLLLLGGQCAPQQQREHRDAGHDVRREQRDLHAPGLLDQPVHLSPRGPAAGRPDRPARGWRTAW
jgi:hypothetical protein